MQVGQEWCCRCSQHQVDVIYFDLSSTFNLIPHTLLLHKLSACRLSDAYVSWLRSYITSHYSVVRIQGIYSMPIEVLSCVQGFVLGPLWSNVFINDLCNSIKHSRDLLFVDDIKIFCTISSVTECTPLQSDNDSTCVWGDAIVWNLTITKLKKLPLQGKLTQLIIITNCVINV
jgi:hypothetical protein